MLSPNETGKWDVHIAKQVDHMRVGDVVGDHLTCLEFFAVVVIVRIGGKSWTSQDCQEYEKRGLTEHLHHLRVDQKGSSGVVKTGAKLGVSFCWQVGYPLFFPAVLKTAPFQPRMQMVRRIYWHPARGPIGAIDGWPML